MELGEDVGAALVLEAPVLDLAEDRLAGLSPTGAERLLQPSIPQLPDHLGASVLLAAGAEPGAVPHLGERGLQVADVRRLVRADERDEIGRPPVAGH